MGKVYLIASGKGGTGKTMFSVNLGATLAQRGYSVAIVDMDMGMRNLDLYLGLENNVVYDVYDVVTGTCQIKQALVQDYRFPALYIIGASPERDKGDLTPLHMQVLCEKLKNIVDFVIIDAPSGRGDGLVMASAGADKAIIVSAPEYAALRDADIIDRTLMELGIGERYLVINKLIPEMMEKGIIPDLKSIDSMMLADLIGVIPFDVDINISTNTGEPMALVKGSYVKENFDNIASRVLMSDF